MSDKKIPISQFAEIVASKKGGGYTVQAVYKKSRKDEKFNSYIDRTIKPWTIKESALQVFYGIEVETETGKVEKKLKEVETEFKEVENKPKESKKQESQESFSQVIKILNDQLDAQRKELEIKNKQIADLLDIIKANGQTLNQQQALNLVDKREILKIESADNKQKNKNKFSKWFNNLIFSNKGDN